MYHRVFLLAAIAAMMAGCLHGIPKPARRNLLKNPPWAVDRLVIDETPEVFAKGELDNVRLSEGDRLPIVLDPPKKRFPRRGTVTSRVIKTAFPFNELILSYNVTCPERTGVVVEARTAVTRHRWSPWWYFGSWGAVPSKLEVTRAASQGVVNTDYLELRRPAKFLQYRLRLFSFDPARSPGVRRVALVYSNTTQDRRLWDRFHERVDLAGSDWARVLDVPFCAQGDADSSISGSICSPTSTSMVMAYWGVDVSPQECALGIYDREFGLFGVWPRATQWASQFGLASWITRFRTWAEVKREIARGQPVIASIRCGPDVLANAPYHMTSGHVLVIRGFTPEGDVVVNDPASSERGEAIVYRAEELARAWFDHGGVAYIIRPEKQPDLQHGQ